MPAPHDPTRVALVTGAARRIGAEIVTRLHESGYRVIIHYGRSADDANALVDRLNDRRHDTARAIGADLRRIEEIERLAANTVSTWGRLDVLVNNASTFYRLTLEETDADAFDDLVGVNLRAPFFLTRALAAELRRWRGAIVNITDVYADRPLAGYAAYCAAKAALVNLTRSLARELAPEVRVNAVAPGAILWPEDGGDLESRSRLIRRTPLARLGEPADVANAVLFLLDGDDFVTGQVINVDGGRSVVP